MENILFGSLLVAFNFDSFVPFNEITHYSKLPQKSAALYNDLHKLEIFADVISFAVSHRRSTIMLSTKLRQSLKSQYEECFGTKYATDKSWYDKFLTDIIRPLNKLGYITHLKGYHAGSTKINISGRKNESEDGKIDYKYNAECGMLIINPSIYMHGMLETEFESCKTPYVQKKYQQECGMSRGEWNKKYLESFNKTMENARNSIAAYNQAKYRNLSEILEDDTIEDVPAEILKEYRRIYDFYKSFSEHYQTGIISDRRFYDISTGYDNWSKCFGNDMGELNPSDYGFLSKKRQMNSIFESQSISYNPALLMCNISNSAFSSICTHYDYAMWRGIAKKTNNPVGVIDSLMQKPVERLKKAYAEHKSREYKSHSVSYKCSSHYFQVRQDRWGKEALGKECDYLVKKDIKKCETFDIRYHFRGIADKVYDETFDAFAEAMVKIQYTDCDANAELNKILIVINAAAEKLEKNLAEVKKAIKIHNKSKKQKHHIKMEKQIINYNNIQKYKLVDIIKSDISKAKSYSDKLKAQQQSYYDNIAAEKKLDSLINQAIDMIKSGKGKISTDYEIASISGFAYGSKKQPVSVFAKEWLKSNNLTLE